VSQEPCPSFVTVDPDRVIRCTAPAGHGPAEGIHQGLLRVWLPDGREHAASLVWSTESSPWEAQHLRRAR
jgi:hypothetical protein